MNKTSIEWTDATWNPVRGCSRVSEGCGSARGGGCYAERIAVRFSGPGQPYEGLASRETGRWTGKVRFVPELLDAPLRWRKPRRVFVNSMSDLFHEKLTDEEIAAVFGVMAAAPQHSFQILTKRAERMRDTVARLDGPKCYRELAFTLDDGRTAWSFGDEPAFPFPNVWLGVSVENQATADERIPHLLATPAAVRFVSYEPALGAVDFGRWMPDPAAHAHAECRVPLLDWLIIGGESGPRARPFDIAWARSVVRQCRDAGTACFVKQVGARPIVSGHGGTAPLMPTGGVPLCAPVRLRDPKGGDMAEWPEDLRVREFPGGAA